MSALLHERRALVQESGGLVDEIRALVQESAALVEEKRELVEESAALVEEKRELVKESAARPLSLSPSRTVRRSSGSAPFSPRGASRRGEGHP
jgi:hypothetical protein